MVRSPEESGYQQPQYVKWQTINIAYRRETEGVMVQTCSVSAARTGSHAPRVVDVVLTVIIVVIVMDCNDRGDRYLI